MPIGEEYANSLVVKVAGRVLAPGVRDRLVHGYVDDSVHAPSMFVLRFSDPHGRVLGELGAKIGEPVTVSVKQSSQGSPVELIDGDITALEQEIDERGSFVTIRGLDLRYRLQSGASLTAYSQMSVADVVRKIAQDHGLRAQTTVSGAAIDHFAKDLESDWDFLCRLAADTRSVMWMEGRTLHFGPPTKASRAPSGTDSTMDPVVIERGSNLVSLRATLTGAGQVPKLEARSWSPAQKKELVAEGQVTSDAAALSTNPKALAQELKGTPHVMTRSELTVQARTAAVATAAAAARAGGFAELEGVVRGNPVLGAGTAVNLAGVAPAFAGKYVLTTVRHDFDPIDGYLTSICAADTSDRSVYGVINGGATSLGAHEPWRGVLVALVTNLKDPEGLGRVKVKLPALSGDYESWWARPVQLGAGHDRGASWLPEVGDEVLIAFGQGSVDEPYVLGGLYNGKDKAGQGWAQHVNNNDGTVRRRALTSRKGMIVEFIEDSQNESLTVSTSNGEQHLTLTQKPTGGIVLVSKGKIEVTAQDDVTITGQKNITANTDTGDFSVKAMNVTIEATQGMKLKGTQLAAEGTASAELKGANVKVAGQAAAELSAGAMTTVRGAMVKIN